MEQKAMGKVIVTARIENLVDVENREQGVLPPEQVRSVVVNDALVDTGATTLLLPKRLIRQLGLRHYRTRESRGIGGPVQMPMYSAVWLTIDDRECALDVGEIDDLFPVLIGQVPLELLDFVVDCKAQRLIGNPAHGGHHVMEVF
ncbi:MAG TPA: aspartyl protease family protein [Pirellulales bacterium]|nr:aspartyl protease family protein [Pirellulales bacterium]